jgi:hypothetical protein
MEYKFNNKDYYKFIIDTDNATITNNSTEFSFKNMLPINIKTESYLKVTAISSTISNDNVYLVRLKSGIEYNKTKYFDTGRGSPVLIVRCFNGKSSLNLSSDGIVITPQVITDLVLEIKDTSDTGLTTAGQKMIIEMIIEEKET